MRSSAIQTKVNKTVESLPPLKPIIQGLSLVSPDEEINGRFTLYPTQNMYNFILLDQVNGKTYKVQWHNEEEKRFIRPIY